MYPPVKIAVAALSIAVGFPLEPVSGMPVEAKRSASPTLSTVSRTDPSGHIYFLDPNEFYPEREMRLGIEGFVVLTCTVAPDYKADACNALPEQLSTNLDFELAARRMSKAVFSPFPTSRPGQIVQFKVAFKLPPGAANPPNNVVQIESMEPKP